MIKYAKIWGNPLKSFIEISIDFSRWLIGFGWGYYNYSTPTFYIHFNLGPIVFLFSY